MICGLTSQNWNCDPLLWPLGLFLGAIFLISTNDKQLHSTISWFQSQRDCRQQIPKILHLRIIPERFNNSLIISQ